MKEKIERVLRGRPEEVNLQTEDEDLEEVKNITGQILQERVKILENEKKNWVSESSGSSSESSGSSKGGRNSDEEDIDLKIGTGRNEIEVEVIEIEDKDTNPVPTMPMLPDFIEPLKDNAKNPSPIEPKRESSKNGSSKDLISIEPDEGSKDQDLGSGDGSLDSAGPVQGSSKDPDDIELVKIPNTGSKDGSKGHMALKQLSEGSEKGNMGGKLIDGNWYYMESDGERRNILGRTPAEQREYLAKQEEERNRI